MNCGHIEENPGALDQCYSNNNFVTTAVLGVRNYVLLEPRLREFHRNVFSRVKEYTLLQCFAYGCVGIWRVSYFDSVRDYLLSGI